MGNPRRQRLARHKVRRELAEDLAVSEFDGDKLVRTRHRCPLGCCDSLETARAKMAGRIKAVALTSPPDIPACNRWLLLYGPEVFWAIFKFLGLDKEFEDVALCNVSENDVLEIGLLDSIGPGDEQTYDRKKQVRFRKTGTMLGRPFILEILVAHCVCSRVVLAFMGCFFDDARMGPDSTLSIGEFCIPARSPALRTINRYFDLLADGTDLFWLPLRAIGGWTEATPAG